mmetsp:Transcript_59755/g.192299  ORF Transcript_59755/g.192299 Transcript_59755/m.192299 type:complete len:313 (+) Transcript_59755:458-1396(+)
MSSSYFSSTRSLHLLNLFQNEVSLDAMLLHLPTQAHDPLELVLHLLSQCLLFLLDLVAVRHQVFLQVLEHLHPRLHGGQLRTQLCRIAGGSFVSLHRRIELALKAVQLSLGNRSLTPLNDLSALPGFVLDDLPQLFEFLDRLLLEICKLAGHDLRHLRAQLLNLLTLLRLHLLQRLCDSVLGQDPSVQSLDLLLELLPLLLLLALRLGACVGALLQPLDALQVPLAHLHQAALAPVDEGGLLNIPDLHHLLGEAQRHECLAAPISLRANVCNEHRTCGTAEAVPEQHCEGGVPESGGILVPGVQVVDDRPQI